MKTSGGVALLAFLLLLTACSTGRTLTNRSAVSPATTSRPGINLRQIPTGTPAPAPLGAPQAAGYAIEALTAFPAGAAGSLQPLVPLLFSNASALDYLRLSTDVGAPADTVPALLQGLGWSWLTVEDGVEGGASYRQWRVVVIGFAEAGGAERYLAHPFLLPQSLAEGSTGDVPAGLPAGARLLRAADTVVPLNNPATAVDGERAVLLWQRARLIFQVIESAAPAPVDLTLLAQLAGSMDQRHDLIAGGSTP